MNTIRPEFLLSFNDYNAYAKTLPEDVCEYKYMKLN